jgi:hypothetical protein
MRTGITIDLTAADRVRLDAVVANRNSPLKHVWRAQIVLLSADRHGTTEIMRVTGKSKTCLWRWQERFMTAGTDGLLRDKTRPSRIAPLGADVAESVVELTQTDPPGETTHWTSAVMAEAAGISACSVQRIWRSHGLQPHRMRQFKLSNDPQFAAKVRDIVGLYVDPPAHAVVLSVDEKSQIQALDRTQPPPGGRGQDMVRRYGGDARVHRDAGGRSRIPRRWCRRRLRCSLADGFSRHRDDARRRGPPRPSRHDLRNQRRQLSTARGARSQAQRRRTAAGLIQIVTQ